MKATPYNPNNAVIMYRGKCMTIGMMKIVRASTIQDLLFQESYKKRKAL